jgi:hypothetical protein
MLSMKYPTSLIAISALLALPAQAAITVNTFGTGTTLPQEISELGTTVGSNSSVGPGYRALNSSDSNFKFVRHVLSEAPDPEVCHYWFRADSDPTTTPYLRTEAWSDVYWFVVDTCIFVDNAQDGTDNFVLLRSESTGMLVGVLQYHLDDNEPFTASLLAYAVDPNGLTFADGVAAIQAVPEPSAILLSGAALTFAGLRRRRSH